MAASSFGIVFILIAFIVLAGLIFMAVMFFRTLSDALRRCTPKNRMMAPANVWLLFIPFFNFVWIFMVVNAVSTSLKNEYGDRGLPSDHDFAKTIGIIYGICLVVNAIFRIARLEGIAGIIGLAGLVLLIIYWVKIANYKNKLTSANLNSGLNGDLLDS